MRNGTSHPDSASQPLAALATRLADQNWKYAQSRSAHTATAIYMFAVKSGHSSAPLTMQRMQLSQF